MKLEYLVIGAVILILLLNLARAPMRRPRPGGYGAGSGTSAPAGRSGSSGRTVTTWFKDHWKQAVIGLAVTSGVVLAGAALWFLWNSGPSLKAPTLGQAWQFVKGYWLWMLVILVIAFAIPAFFDEKKKLLRENVRTIVVLIGCLFFLGVPIAYWAVGDDGPVQTFSRSVGEQEVCPQYSSAVARECVVTGKKVRISTPEPTRQGEFEFCWLKPEHAILEDKKVGINTFEYRSGGDAFLLKYKMVRREALVNGNCPPVL